MNDDMFLGIVMGVCLGMLLAVVINHLYDCGILRAWDEDDEGD